MKFEETKYGGSIEKVRECLLVNALWDVVLTCSSSIWKQKENLDKNIGFFFCFAPSEVASSWRSKGVVQFIEGCSSIALQLYFQLSAWRNCCVLGKLWKNTLAGGKNEQNWTLRVCDQNALKTVCKCFDHLHMEDIQRFLLMQNFDFTLFVSLELCLPYWVTFNYTYTACAIKPSRIILWLLTAAIKSWNSLVTFVGVCTASWCKGAVLPIWVCYYCGR